MMDLVINLISPNSDLPLSAIGPGYSAGFDYGSLKGNFIEAEML